MINILKEREELCMEEIIFVTHNKGKIAAAEKHSVKECFSN